jgi:hypothetical protein
MQPHDGGPIYAETRAAPDNGPYPVEPWNTWSNLIFVAVIVYFIRHTSLNIRRYRLVVLSLPILFVGWCGGTLFHATRADVVWLILDILPIVTLSIAVGLSFWRMVVHSWGKAVACFFGIAVSGRFLATLLVADHALRISFWYISMALPIVLPLFVVVQRKARSEKILFIGVLASFAVAVIFRMWDRTGVEPLLPMGTHFLWHLFGGVAVFLLMLLQVRIVEQASSLRE